MCGRTACHSGKTDVCQACRYKDKNGCTRKPRWKDAPAGQTYNPGYNVSPGSHTPVLLSSEHFVAEFEGDQCEGDRFIQPMQWGLIPPWSSDPKSTGYSMNNCRSESMLEKRAFKIPLEKGRRCVILANGYYEWKTDKISGKKQPYFIYTPKPSETEETAETEDADQSAEPMLHMAGVFERWKPKMDGDPLYSYSVITVEASPAMQFIHHRMPAILKTEEEVRQWLDAGDVPLSKAVKLCKSTEMLQQHPVSTIVNNSRNNQPDCVKPIDLEKQEKKANASKNFMMSWLGKKKKAEDTKGTNELEPENKKRKIDK